MELNARIVKLQSLAETEDIRLPYPVACYIATAAPTANARELAGLLIRLVAYASLTEQDITVPLAREVLGDQISEAFPH